MNIPPESQTLRANRMSPELERWIVEQTGGELVCTKRLPGGNRREAWAVDVAVGGATQELFLRYDPSDPTATGDYYTILRESTFYTALKDSAIAIPRIVAVHSEHQAMLTERGSGSSAFLAADRDEQCRVSLDFMEHLAQLHRLDTGFVRHHFPSAGRSIADLVHEEIDIWTGLYAQTPTRDPLIEFALTWLTRNIPDVDEPAGIVHGDAGPGNFLFAAGKVTALLDWELAHLGDPMEDLAWLSMRTVLEPFPDFARCLRCYERAAVRRIDLKRLRYYRALVSWRVAIIRHRNAGADVANSLISRVVNRRLLVDAIAAAAQQPIAPYVHVSAPHDQDDELYDAGLSYLRDIIAPAIEDPYAARKTKSVARILKYLQQANKLRPIMAPMERGTRKNPRARDRID